MKLSLSMRGLISVRVFLLVLMLGNFCTVAQISQTRRYERQQKNSDDYFNVISLKTEGLALFRERDKFKGANRLWELILLDTALQEKGTLDLEVNDRYKMIGYEVVPDQIYFLYRTGETTKNDFELIEIGIGDSPSVTARYQIKPELDFKLTHFIKAGTNFIFGGYVNNEPAIVLYELPSKNIRVIPGFFQKDTELVDLRTNQNQTFNTVLVDRSTKENRKLVLRTFDETGKQLLEDLVPIEEGKTLQTGITSTLQREDLAVIGSWGERNSKQSIGFYFLDINPFQDQPIKYLDFGQLSHHLDYLPSKRAERIKQSSKDDLKAGRIPNFTSYVMPFSVAEYSKGFILLAEVYNPVSTTSPYYSNPYYYNPYYSPYGFYPYGFYYPGMSRMYRPYAYNNATRNTNEIRTSSTSVISFGSDGKVNWDYSFKLDEMKMSGLEQVGDYIMKNDQIYILYKKESELKLKVVSLQDGQALENTMMVKLEDPLDEIRSEKEYEGGVRQWQSDAFYVWGYQTVRNTTKEDRVRDVFYINKVVVR